jgi:hypothetical protein
MSCGRSRQGHAQLMLSSPSPSFLAAYAAWQMAFLLHLSTSDGFNVHILSQWAHRLPALGFGCCGLVQVEHGSMASPTAV